MPILNKHIKNYGHTYHLVSPSPFPLFASFFAFITAVGAIFYMYNLINGLAFLVYGLFGLLSIFTLWCRDIIRESTYEGRHTIKVQKSLKIGFILFIISEIMFFFGFFWAFFHSSLSPSHIIGSIWPPAGIIAFWPLGIPLVNTIVLLSSGISITLAHHAISSGSVQNAIIGFFITIILGFYFTLLQLIEYVYAPFSISDGIFGSVFYMITGLHGVHVIIGTLFLIVTFYRLLNNHFTKEHHLGVEFSIWYWHFVDIVWLFVYSFLYVFAAI